MANQHISSEEAKAMVALWSQQQTQIETRPKLSDVAEALDITPEQAHELWTQVQKPQQHEGGHNQRPGTDNRHSLARFNSRLSAIHPAFSILSVMVFGFTSFVWTGFSWGEWISFPISAVEKAGLIASNAGLWLLFIKWVRSINRDVRRRARRR